MSAKFVNAVVTAEVQKAVTSFETRFSKHAAGLNGLNIHNFCSLAIDVVIRCADTEAQITLKVGLNFDVAPSR